MKTDNELSETTKSRSGAGCLKHIGCGALILLMFVAIGAFWHRARMASKLEETLAELDRSEPGWRLEDIEAARGDLLEEENSAPVVIAAAERMPKAWLSSDFPVQHFDSLPPNEILSGEDFVLLSTQLTKARSALDAAARLADMPRGRHPIHYERNPIMTLLPHLEKCRNLVPLLLYESMRLNQKGKSKEALTACRAALNVARSIGDEPLYISQLVRFACVMNVCRAVERTLAQGEPPPEDMEVWQKLLQDEDAFPGLLIAARGERAALHKVFAAVDSGEVSLKELEGLSRSSGRSAEDWLQNAALSLWRMDTREDNALFLSFMTRLIKATQLPMHEQAAQDKEFDREFRALPKNAAITRLLLPAMTKMSDAFRREHSWLRCTLVALAAERYRRDKKTWPDNAEKLCPQYISAVPLDPLDGKSLRFRRVEDGIIIYSVGQDGVDDGGNLDRERPLAPGTDIGIRLWDVAQRRQPARPKPPAPQPAAGMALPASPK